MTIKTILNNGYHQTEIEVDLSDEWHSMNEPMPAPKDGLVEYLVCVASGDIYGHDVKLYYDMAYYTQVTYPDGIQSFELETTNDWDEGQPWRIIAWKELPPLPNIIKL